VSKGAKEMSSGATGVTPGAAASGYSSAGVSTGGQVNPSTGAPSTNDGKGSTTVQGEGNAVGNTQNQTNINNNYTSNYGMNTADFTSLHNQGRTMSTDAAQAIGQLNMEDIQKLMMIMMIMKMLEAFMNNSDGGGGEGGGQQGGFSGIM
jgi:hypothetical protein